ncbi:MAG: formylmethanofuran dehydrogenase [Deltaproteobacteria bacterium]|nr:MAG: formylmethanofuran dehydrogenase [Deltaproteobacteria bacterium]
MSCQIDKKTMEQVISFHGHSCPGLMIGIRASEAALQLFPEAKPADLVAVMETDMCGVDAVQYLTGCTFGKGNLIHKDYGKMAFSFFHRPSGKGVRFLLNPEIRLAKEMEKLTAKGKAGKKDKEQTAALRQEMQDVFFNADLQEMFFSQPLDQLPPRPPRVLKSLTCETCGEQTMESRTRRFDGKTLCIPCFNEVEQKV